ncbi:MAG: FAD-dependent tricarballylate dehydrogenase TcuA [Chloroflexi bacterium]|nr:FAD-dependent tricarballylate dehydrogenase TcuA [Chloroflexota bacterium]
MQTRGMYDVIVVGAGNAALCAALSAQEHGAHVLVLERAPHHLRGGNTYFTAGGLRFPFEGIEDIKALVPDLSENELRSADFGRYPKEQFYSDLMRVTEGLADPELVQMLVDRAYPTMKWLQERGIRWVPMYGRQAYKIGDRFRFYGGLVLEAVGGGAGLSDRLFELAEQSGIETRYEMRATRLLVNKDGSMNGLTIRGPHGYEDISARAIVLACGGFEANPEWRTRYLGPDWELAKVRGTRYNTGDGIQMALEIGAQPYGHWSSCHAVAWDANAPPYGDRKVGDLFQKHSYPLGIIVNIQGKRFVDEGADIRNYTYVKYGREILKQPGRLAFQVFDEKVRPLLRDEYRIPQMTYAQANTIEELAERLGVDREGLASTVRGFNAAVQPGEFNPAVLDGKGTRGIIPPKSNWALPVDTPPFLGYAVTCGITFTFGGLKVSEDAQVMDTDGRPIPGLYAAGELVGGLFYYNYPGGSGLMAGAAFGRIAGESAAVKTKSLRR